LIGGGKLAQAVDAARDLHKRHGTSETEALVIDAYVARIASLEERNLNREANELTQLVRERYASSSEKLHYLSVRLAARRGQVDVLAGPLNDPLLPAERRAEIETIIRCEVTNIAALAGCEALPVDHPIRAGAGSVLRGLTAVTSGPVAAEALALPEISRRSPLAPWKMLVRAIAAFYRRDEEACRNYVEAIELDAAPARIVPVLDALLGKHPALTAAAQSLLSKIGGRADVLAGRLTQLDSLLDEKSPQALPLITQVVIDCEESCPDLLVRLKQHISVRALLADLPADRVLSAMRGPSRKDAYFWRLLARTEEERRGNLLAACAYWEQFRRHAVHEGWFPGKGAAMATVYLHMTDLLSRLSDGDLRESGRHFANHWDGLSAYYRGQPPEICAFKPSSGLHDLYFLNPHPIYERACASDPCTANFQRWLAWAKQHRPEEADPVAWHWRVALSSDVEPLLHLMDAAEKTNALQKAFQFMQQAEQLDPVNAEVRKARMRLLVAIAMRHLRNKKAKLLDKDIRELEVLPQVRQGDRPAFVAALRWACATLWKATEEAAAAKAEIARLMGCAIAGEAVIGGLARAGRMEHQVPASFAQGDLGLAGVIGRACALGEDVGVPFDIPKPLSDQLYSELAAKDAAVDAAALSALGEAALRVEDRTLAYAASAAGLRLNGATQARFLFLRARALPSWEEERLEACVDAAAQLARFHRDLDLLDRIRQWHSTALGSFQAGDMDVAMTSAEINEVIEEETALPDYPDDVTDENSECNCAACQSARSSLPPELRDMVETFGPEAVARAMAEMLLDTGAKGGKKRGGRIPFNFPF
jgi:hypothetical protein